MDINKQLSLAILFLMFIMVLLANKCKITIKDYYKNKELCCLFLCFIINFSFCDDFL